MRIERKPVPEPSSTQGGHWNELDELEGGGRGRRISGLWRI
jgi:hypothetical protein